MYPSNKPYSSKEVAQVVDRWQFCRFFDLKTQAEIISISYHELYRRGSQLSCDPAVLARIKSALSDAYQKGIREVGMLAPHFLRIELIKTALSVTDDPDWKIEPREELTYFKNLYEIETKIRIQAEYEAELNVELTAIEKDICDDLGFTDEVIDELIEYIDAETPFEELPQHLQKLFREGQEPEKKSE